MVVDKPFGVSVRCPDGDRRDDLVTRVRQMRDDADLYLNHHGHLDRDVSGLVLFATDPSLNASLSRQLDQGRIDVSYAVAVTRDGSLAPDIAKALRAPHRERGWTELRVAATKDRHGGWSAKTSAKAGTKTGAKTTLVVRFCVLRGEGRRWVLKARSPQGARAIRVALEHVGLSVGGDGSARACAPRCMMHAMEMAFRHPRTGLETVVTTPLPWQFDMWSVGSWTFDSANESTARRAIVECAVRRLRLRCDAAIGGFRLLHGEGDGLEGLDVEWLSDYAVVWMDEARETTTNERRNHLLTHVVEALATLKPKGIYVKKRPTQASRVTDDEMRRLVSSRAAWGQDAPERLEVQEGQRKYFVRLGDGLSTGLFLDQREHRRWMQCHAVGKRVLNLFAYTCSFTVAAAAGGATRTVSVDVSRRSLDLGRENLAHNGLDNVRHQFVCQDAQRWLRAQVAERARDPSLAFDIVVLDPPSFGSSTDGTFSVMHDFAAVAALCMEVMAEEGWLMACTNHRRVSFAKLVTWLEKAAAQTARTIVARKLLPLPPDFPTLLPGHPHVKVLLCRVVTNRQTTTRPGSDQRRPVENYAKANSKRRT